MATSQLEAEVNDIANWIRGLADKLQTLAGNAIVSFLPGIGPLVRSLRDAANTILQKILSIGSHVKEQIGGAVNTLVPSAIQILSNVITNIGNDIHWLLSNLATAEQFAAGFIGEVVKHMPGFGTILSAAITGGVAPGILEVLKYLEGQEPEVIDTLLDELLKLHNLPPWLKTMIAGVRGRKAEWQIVPVTLIVGWIIISAASSIAQPVMTEVEQNANAQVQSAVLPPGELVAARIKDLIPDTQFYNEMRQNNFNDDRSQTMLLNQQERLLPEEVSRLVYRGQMQPHEAERELGGRGLTAARTEAKILALRPILDEETIRTIYLRGFVNDAQHDALMRQLGYADDAIQRRKSIYYLIPGPNDLIHMAIRNVFSPEIVERFQLFGDFPPAFEAAAKQQGISRDWAIKYWGAHWIVPSNQEGFDMFHRTTLQSEDEHADTFTLSDGTKVQNIIGRSTLQLLLREKDTAPYYRQKITEIAYNPLTRIDVRRMHRVGSLTHAGVERAYLDLGYSPQNARRLADFVEKLNSKDQKDQYQGLINGLARRVLTYYGQGKLVRMDADTALHDLGLTDDEIGFYLAEEDLLIEADTATQVETGVGKLYTGSLITVDDATKRLKEAGVTDLAITRLFQKWNLTLEFQDLKASTVKARDLTKSEILAAVREKLMSDDDARPMLQNLGFDAAEVEIELALAKYQEQKQTTQAQIDALKALFVNGVREPLDVSNSLDALGLNTYRRDALLSEWQLQREQRTEKIPQATIRDMVIARYISEDDALTQLKRHRLSDDDALLLLQFWLQKQPTGGRTRG